MNKILRWYVEGGISRTKVEVGGKHKLDRDYTPVGVNMMVRVVGSGTTSTIIDINSDGTSIFLNRPALGSKHLEKTWTSFKGATLRRGSIITLDIDQIPNLQGARDLTVELELER